MTISLEYKARGVSGWSSQAEATSDVIPSVRRTVYQVKAACRAGAWRIRAHASGSLQGKEFDFSDFSVERVVAASDCR
jgi:hypothetical protein